MQIRYLSAEELVIHELDQARQEGKDVEELDDQWNTLVTYESDQEKLRPAARKLLDHIRALPADARLIADEPSTFNEIRRKSGWHELDSGASIPVEVLYDKIQGGWLGRAAGCLLGKPVEKIGREGIHEILEASGQWPLRDYITARDIPDELIARYPWNRHGGIESLRENIICMPEDDDMNYPIVNLIAAQRHGPDFTTADIALTWLEFLPVLSTFTAERVAYANCLKLVPIERCAVTDNPFREWIGAQIRADLWGWVALGAPLQAAECGWRDGHLSHVRNGLYGEMFFAAAIALAGNLADVESILRGALQVVPGSSRFAEAILFGIGAAREESDWERITDHIHNKYGHLHWVHTLNNAALVAAALIHGAGDYEKSICAAVMGGWDADCNGATVGSLLGTMLGAHALPEKWTAPLHNCLRSSVMGRDHSPLDELARECTSLHPGFTHH
ncbi:MAG TPA: ADP-ribosylglycohydrolase family protein [bacterium]|nr:ADP-ribosylglycohydrolase family protein [bacterium]